MRDVVPRGGRVSTAPGAGWLSETVCTWDRVARKPPAQAQGSAPAHFNVRGRWRPRVCAAGGLRRGRSGVGARLASSRRPGRGEHALSNSPGLALGVCCRLMASRTQAAAGSSWSGEQSSPQFASGERLSPGVWGRLCLLLEPLQVPHVQSAAEPDCHVLFPAEMRPATTTTSRPCQGTVTTGKPSPGRGPPSTTSSTSASLCLHIPARVRGLLEG